jgi:membrane fusion protein (multidrug efflux system)
VDDVFLVRDATLMATANAEVAARTEGFVQRLLVQEGDYVKAGDVLAELDDTDARLRLDELVAAHKRADATRNEAQRSAERASKLFDQNIISEDALDDAKAALARARAEAEEAQARAARVREELSHVRIVAPTDGAVTRLLAEAGEYLQRGAPVLELKRIDMIMAVCTVAEADLAQVREGASVQVEFTAFPKEPRSGLVWKIVPDAVVESRSFPVEVLLENLDHRLKPGMSARVSFVQHIDAGIMVPKDSVLAAEDDPHVFVIVKGVAERRDVVLGPEVGDEWHVRSGLALGDTVVVAGNETLAAGQPVLVVDLPPPSAPSLAADEPKSVGL